MDSESAGVYMMSPVPVESLPGDREPSAAFKVIHASTMTRRQPMLGWGRAVKGSPDVILGAQTELTGVCASRSRVDWNALGLGHLTCVGGCVFKWDGWFGK